MKFFQAALAIAAFGMSSALALTDAEIAASRRASLAVTDTDFTITASCDYSTPCLGYNWAPGLHCGDGAYGCTKGRVYQVGSDTNVCDFGVRNTCVDCGCLSCPGPCVDGQILG